MNVPLQNKFVSFIKNKSVALVGPAQYMQGSGYGAEIDKHDTVVRINRGIESIEKYSNDIGQRTDVYYSCLIERAQQTGILNAEELKHKYKIKFIVAPPDSDIQGIASSTKLHSLVDVQKVHKIAQLIPVRIISHVFHTTLAQQVRCKPNTGFLAIYDLIALQPSKLSIYGFSFYLDGFLPGQKAGVENEKNCTEQEFANMAFNSKRHVQKNMWNYAKHTLKNNNVVKLDETLNIILELDDLDRKLFQNKLKITCDFS